jgi:two-component sensor histidine kinase
VDYPKFNFPYFRKYSYDTKRIIKVLLFVAALLIGTFSLLYTNKLVKQLKTEEEKKVAIWAKAQEKLVEAENPEELSFYYSIVEDNKTIPVIMETPEGFLIHRNLDSIKSLKREYVKNKLEEMKLGYPPIPIRITETETAYLYYSDSYLLKQLRDYPYYQIAIVGLFILVSYFAFSISRRAEQNRVWVGLAKETAHQLGTPISSLMAWTDLIEMDRELATPEAMEEMRKDLVRLETITERFSKIGSEPILQKVNLNEVLKHSVQYMKTRSSERIEYVMYERHQNIMAHLNVPLFEWVIENLCKNAMDAMGGSGKITFTLRLSEKNNILLDVSDNGKGIPKNKFKTIFKPGYTTKKRGWGLGLSLVKRIIQNYHKGTIFVKESVPNERTVFRIILKAAKIK